MPKTFLAAASASLSPPCESPAPAGSLQRSPTPPSITVDFGAWWDTKTAKVPPPHSYTMAQPSDRPWRMPDSAMNALSDDYIIQRYWLKCWAPDYHILLRYYTEDECREIMNSHIYKDLDRKGHDTRRFLVAYELFRLREESGEVAEYETPHFTQVIADLRTKGFENDAILRILQRELAQPIHKQPTIAHTMVTHPDEDDSYGFFKKDIDIVDGNLIIDGRAGRVSKSKYALVDMEKKNG